MDRHRRCLHSCSSCCLVGEIEVPDMARIAGLTSTEAHPDTPIMTNGRELLINRLAPSWGQLLRVATGGRTPTAGNLYAAVFAHPVAPRRC